jgi:AAA15 family ATPase/GTPase
MILEFSVENTYSIKDRQTISFEAAGESDDEHIINIGNKKLLKLSAIYGANASGKSNIIKALDFYIRFSLDSFTMLKPEEKISFEPFLFDENTRQSSGFFEIVFYFKNNWYKYQIRLNRENVLTEYFSAIGDNDESIIFSFDAGNNEHQYQKEDEELLRFVRPNATFLSTAAQFNHTFLGEIYRHLKFTLGGTFGELELLGYTRNMLFNEQIRIRDIIGLFDKAGIDHISGIMIEDRNDEDRKEEIMFVHDYEKKYILSFFSESMGTRRFFELAGPLWECIHHEKNLFIDELESSLHDDLIEFFIRSFLENTTNSQLLFTTHNQGLLDSALLRNDEAWFVQKDNDGGSDFFSLAEFNDIPENVSRRELYKAGAFGALPRTSKFFKE